MKESSRGGVSDGGVDLSIPATWPGSVASVESAGRDRNWRVSNVFQPSRRRDRARRTSTLQDIPGVGPKRRRELLRFFGGLQGVRHATREELARVPGISVNMATAIHQALHG